MNRLYTTFLFLAFILSACSHTKNYNKINISGTYHSHTKWNGNDIYITLRKDSEFTFKAIKEYCPGKKFFCTAGKWSVKDSILLLECDTIKRDFKTYFPEVADTANVISLNINGNFLLSGQKIYDLNADGSASKDKFYDKIN